MSEKSTKSIGTAFLLNLGFSIFELIGGIYVNSISIISDSIHDFGDAFSIAISWILDKKSQKKPDSKYTYGYLRMSVLGALINSVVLLIGSTIMIYNAISRLIHPEDVNYNGVLILAIIGLIVNGLGAYKTGKGKAISEKVVSLHLLEDVLGWAAVLICSLLMKIFDLPILDPILSIGISAFILFNVFRNLKKIFELFLEKAPNDVNTQHIVKGLMGNPLVKDVHHIHLWSIDSINNFGTIHVVLDGNLEADKIIEIKQYVRHEFANHNVAHVTIEIEYENEACNEHECNIDNMSNSDIHHHGYNH